MPALRKTRTPLRQKGQQCFVLPKGLTRKEAYLAASKKATRDFRGIQYDPVTGKTILT